MEEKTVLMCSIISFGNVRISGMGKNLVTPYAALGVGLAVVLTFGLTAISSVMQPSQTQSQLASQREWDQTVLEEPLAAEPEAKMMAPKAQPEQPSPVPSETQTDVSSEAVEPVAGPTTGAGGEITAQVEMKEQEAQEELAREGYSIATEVPVSASSSSFAGIGVVLPYIVAAAVGSVVFVISRKRVGW